MESSHLHSSADQLLNLKVVEQERQASTSQATLPSMSSGPVESHPAARPSAAAPADPAASGAISVKTGTTLTSPLDAWCYRVSAHICICVTKIQACRCIHHGAESSFDAFNKGWGAGSTADASFGVDQAGCRPGLCHTSHAVNDVSDIDVTCTKPVCTQPKHWLKRFAFVQHCKASNSVLPFLLVSG